MSTDKLLQREQIPSHYERWKNIKGSTDEEDRKLKRQRGYELEKLIYSVLYYANLDPSSSYDSKGEQVDGAFSFNSFPFLVEAKWHAKPIEASKIYAFKGKVDGKFHLNSGVFISMSDYSADAPDALRIGKTANVLLFGIQDMEGIFLEKYSFGQVLNYKLQRASRYGELYMPFGTIEEAAQLTAQQVPAPVLTKTALRGAQKKVLVITPDQNLLDPFIENIKGQNLLSKVSFNQMTFISSDPINAAVKNVHRILLEIPEISSYQALILLYPLNNPIYSFDNDQYVFLNKTMIEAGVTNGVMIITMERSGFVAEDNVGESLLSFLSMYSSQSM